MLFLAIAMLGVISYVRLPVDLLPDISYPKLVIYTSYADVAPAEVERLVTELVEAEAAAVPGAEKVTSVSREGVEGTRHAQEKGGLSGAPILKKSTAVLRAFAAHLPGTTLIGAGGILSGADAADKFAAGASLVQLYTGLIYRGPKLVSECVSAYRAK